MKKIYVLILAIVLSVAAFAQTGPITGPLTVCSTYQVTLSCSPGGCTWSSSNPLIATIGSSSGLVTAGLTAGVVTITYNCGSSGFSTAQLTVNPLPATITCPTSGCNVCLGSSITVTDPTPGGIWSTQIPSIATVGSSSGVVTGVSLGTTVLSYALVPTGCFVTSLVTVFPNPSAITITGSSSICVGSTTTVTATPPLGTPPGTWISSPITVATINTGGVITGVGAGVATITYMLGTGCYSVTTITVCPTPVAIPCPSSTRPCNVCVGSTLPLTNGTPGGIWSSSNTGIAIVGSSSGIVTGVAPGIVVITYSILPCGCSASTTITVNPNPVAYSMVGGGSYCSGGVGVPVGISNSQVGVSYQLMCGASPVGVPVAGTGAGISFGLQTSPCIYTVVATNAFGCQTTMGSVTVVVNPTPGPIICGVPGTSCSVCVGDSITLFDAVPGGIWSSSNPAVATVGSLSGVVTGVSPGTVTIIYTLPGGCFVTITITICPLPNAYTVTGGGSYCAGGPGVLVGLSNSQVGVTYQLMCGASPVGSPVAGTGAAISFGLQTSACVYTVLATNSCGCHTVMGSVTITINPTPGPISCAVVGTSCMVCVGSTILLTDPTPGGIWSSSNPLIATVGATSGIVTGISPGVVVITYTIGSCSVSITIIVNPNPGPITGVLSVCVGSTTSLSCSPGGGVWSSSNTAVGTISTTGVVTGISAGVTTITYMLGTGCYSVVNVTVNPNPTITGTFITCVGGTTLLTGSPTGGIWTSANPGIATVGAGTGIVTGIVPGTTLITYTLSTGCSVSHLVTVTPSPGPIACPSLGCQVCVGSSVLLTNPIPGGQWSSSNTGIATVGSASGIVSGVSAGTSYITYTLGGCFVTTLFTVNPLPLPFTVTGGGSYCAGGTGVLVGLSGSQLGVNYQLFCGASPVGSPVAGTGAAISFGMQTGPCVYTVVATSIFGCSTTMTGSVTVTINPSPLPIVCPISGCVVCVGNTITLTDPTTGGVWSSSNPGIATVGSATGVVTGITPGVTIITYAIGSCFVTTAVTVNPNPGPITGTATVCVGGTTTLSCLPTGGTWSNSCTLVTVNSTTGVVTGVSTGICSAVTYTLPGGCYSTINVTVTAMTPITGPTYVCVGSTCTLSNATPGGTWSTSCGIASVNPVTGVVTGIAAGLCSSITYTLPSGCYTTYPINVNPLPCTNGVSELNSSAGNLELFPNPASDEITIKMTGAAYNSYSITNDIGQTILLGSLLKEESSVNIKKLPAAMYYITFRGANGILVKRFVKQ